MSVPTMSHAPRRRGVRPGSTGLMSRFTSKSTWCIRFIWFMAYVMAVSPAFALGQSLSSPSHVDTGVSDGPPPELPHVQVVEDLWDRDAARTSVTLGDLLPDGTREIHLHTIDSDFDSSDELPQLDVGGTLTLLREHLMHTGGESEIIVSGEQRRIIVTTHEVWTVAATIRSNDGIERHVVGLRADVWSTMIDLERASDGALPAVVEDGGSVLFVAYEEDDPDAARDFPTSPVDLDWPRPAPAGADADDVWPVDCHSAWIGHDGFECCRLSAVLGLMLKQCTYNFLSDILTCLVEPGLYALGGCLLGCLGLKAGSRRIDRLRLVGLKLTAKICLAICMAASAAAVIACVLERYFDFLACRTQARIAFEQSLIHHGCPRRPGDRSLSRATFPNRENWR